MTATRQIGPIALLAMVLCATGLPSSGGDYGGGPDGDYTKPPFVRGAAFCASFNRIFVDAIPEPLQFYIYDAQVSGGDDFHRLYDGRLRGWIEGELKNATDEQLARMPPARRFEALANSGDLHLGYNQYLEPARRSVQIKLHNTDAGVLAFYYPWYLDGLSAADSTLTYRDLPPQVRLANETVMSRDKETYR